MADNLSSSYNTVTLFDLPHQDIVFEKIFGHLCLDEIFKCRRVCKNFKDLCDDFFKSCATIDVNNVLHPSTMTSAILEQITLDNSSLHSLIIRNPRFLLEDCVLVDIFRRNCGLQKLDLTNCRMLTSVVIIKLAEYCPQLRELLLSGCVWVSPQSLTKVFEFCPCLERVDLTRCSRTTDQCIQTLAQNSPKLKYISLNQCAGMTDQCLNTLTSYCPCLTHVGISGCILLTDACLKTLFLNCPNLCYIEVDNCYSMTKNGLYFLWDRGIETDVKKELVERSKFWS